MFYLVSPFSTFISSCSSCNFAMVLPYLVHQLLYRYYLLPGMLSFLQELLDFVHTTVRMKVYYCSPTFICFLIVNLLRKTSVKVLSVGANNERPALQPPPSPQCTQNSVQKPRTLILKDMPYLSFKRELDLKVLIYILLQQLGGVLKK